jgi:D-3-phosphoglycerate dehydrogenase / 2-oxoglutarate reductase
MKITCLIIDPTHEIIIPLLEKEGIKVDYRPEIKPEEVLQIIHLYDGIIVRSKMKIDREFLERASRLRFIARAGAGVDLIDVREVEIRNIQLLNAPEGNMDALAEHTVGMTLSLLNNIVRADKQIRKGIWDREGNRGWELGNKTIGLIGFGFMGKAVAKRFASFGCRVIVYDRDPAVIISEPYEAVSIEKLREEADIISFHIPLDEENRNLVDFNYLNGFRKKIWVINTARGEILVLKDLIRLLEEGKVAGAALDVLEKEKPDQLSGRQKAEFEQICSMDNVILTPHVGGWSFESYQKISEVLASKIRDLY